MPVGWRTFTIYPHRTVGSLAVTAVYYGRRTAGARWTGRQFYGWTAAFAVYTYLPAIVTARYVPPLPHTPTPAFFPATQFAACTTDTRLVIHVHTLPIAIHTRVVVVYYLDGLPLPWTFAYPRLPYCGYYLPHWLYLDCPAPAAPFYHTLLLPFCRFFVTPRRSPARTAVPVGWVLVRIRVPRILIFTWITRFSSAPYHRFCCTDVPQFWLLVAVGG